MKYPKPETCREKVENFLYSMGDILNITEPICVTQIMFAGYTNIETIRTYIDHEENMATCYWIDERGDDGGMTDEESVDRFGYTASEWKEYTESFVTH